MEDEHWGCLILVFFFIIKNGSLTNFGKEEEEVNN